MLFRSNAGLLLVPSDDMRGVATRDATTTEMIIRSSTIMNMVEPKAVIMSSLFNSVGQEEGAN